MSADPAAPGDFDPTMMERRIRALNNERQKDMVSDTDKLLKLAQELNDGKKRGHIDVRPASQDRRN
jgi:hypothetical protein